MKLGYHTSGLAHHAAIGGLELVAATGFRSVAISIDHGWMSPQDTDHLSTIAAVKAFLDQQRIDSVIEANAPFLLDPLVRHLPSLVDPDPARAARRIEFLRYCIDVAKELDSSCVSIQSGPKPNGLSFPNALEAFQQNLRSVLQYAAEQNVTIAIEPCPEMLIDTTGRFDRLLHLLDADQAAELMLTLDIGQLFCNSEIPIGKFIEHWRERLINLHICDAKVGQSEHYLIGEGQIYFPPIFESLVNIDYQHSVHIELDRHSHAAVQTVRHSYQMLSTLFAEAADAGGWA